LRRVRQNIADKPFIEKNIMTKSIAAALVVPVLLLFFVVVGKAQSRASVSAAEVNGTYEMNFRGKYKAMSNTIKLLALGRGKVRFSMDLVYPYTLRNGEISVNMGGLDGEADIAGDTGVYQSGEFGDCKIAFKFVRPGTLKVIQDGTDAGCGFGHNVTSAGSYRKVSGSRPKFEDR
jgi:hypothetical protein